MAHAKTAKHVFAGVFSPQGQFMNCPYKCHKFGVFLIGATPRGRPQSDARENGWARGRAPTVALRAASGTAPLPVQNATRHFDRPPAGGTVNDRAMGVCRQGRFANRPYKCKKYGFFG